MERYELLTKDHFEPNSYLKRYDALCNEMNKHLDLGHAEYVSQSLLRKLFYESVENASAIFRIGFIDGCYRFITAGATNRAEYVRNQNQDHPETRISHHTKGFRSYLFSSKLLIVLFFVTSTALVVLFFLKTSRVQHFRDDFTHDSTGVTLGTGWILKDTNEVFWNMPDSLDHLTLYTLPGDNWFSDSVKQPSLDNLLARNLGQGDYNATVLFHDFQPEHNWQQIALLLIQDERNSIRLKYGYDDAWQGKPLMTVTPILKSDGMMIHDLPTVDLEIPHKKYYRHNVWLRIQKTGSEYKFFYKRKDPLANWVQINHSWNVPESFHPKYIAIGAFQGIPQQLPNGTKIPLNWDPVPVHIDYFEIEPK